MSVLFGWHVLQSKWQQWPVSAITLMLSVKAKFLFPSNNVHTNNIFNDEDFSFLSF